jgi:hypothetical protein
VRCIAMLSPLVDGTCYKNLTNVYRIADEGRAPPAADGVDRVACLLLPLATAGQPKLWFQRGFP